jgi:hypothetical protein
MADAAAGVAQLVIRFGKGARDAQSIKTKSMRLLMQRTSTPRDAQVVECLFCRIAIFLEQVEKYFSYVQALQ